MDLVLGRTIELLGVAMVVAILARRLRLPYTVGLVLTGLALALTHAEAGVTLTHDVIFDVILPPLLFEAAISIPWSELKRDLPPVLALATFGVVLCAAVVAVGLTTLLRWPAGPALAFGALIAATDPIAVIALLRETGVKGRLRLIIESESLINDGVAALLFTLVVASLGGTASPPTPLGVLGPALLIGGGGVAVGLAVAGMAILLAGRTSDHLIETALTAVAAYGSFLIAERIGASGVLATVSAGLLMGNLGVLADESDRFALTSQGRAFVVEFWEFAAFVANSLVFLLIGLALAATPTQTLRRARRHRRAGAGRPGGGRLSDLVRLRAFALGALVARATLPVVGRACAARSRSRSPSPCRRPRPTATTSWSARSASSRSRCWFRASPRSSRCAPLRLDQAGG